MFTSHFGECAIQSVPTMFLRGSFGNKWQNRSCDMQIRSPSFPLVNKQSIAMNDVPRKKSKRKTGIREVVSCYVLPLAPAVERHCMKEFGFNSREDNMSDLITD